MDNLVSTTTRDEEPPPLIEATRIGDVESVRRLLQVPECNVNQVDPKTGRTALHYAWYTLEIGRLLLEYGANANIQSNNGYTPLHHVCAANLLYIEDISHVEFLTLLIENGANLEARDIYGHTPLHLICFVGEESELWMRDPISRNRRLAMTEFLIARGANLEAQDNEGFTPLHCACWGGRSEIMSLLIESGVNLEARDNEGFTPLHIAYLFLEKPHPDRFKGLRIDKTLENMQMLIQLGANVDAIDHEGRTALFLAYDGLRKLQGTFENALNELMFDLHDRELDGREDGPNVNLTDKHGTSLLHLAAVCQSTLEHIEDPLVPMRILLWFDSIQINQVDNEGNSPLHLACDSDKATMFLLRKGANRNGANHQGMTPMHLACQGGHLRVVWALLAWGHPTAEETEDLGPAANVNVTNVNKKTPLHLACEGNHLEVVSFLVRQFPELVLPS